MAIRRGGPPKPPSVRRAAAKSAATRAKDKSSGHSAEDLVEAGGSVVDRPSATSGTSATLAAAGRAMIELEQEVAKLNLELGKLLEIFAASDSETKLWSRLAAQRERLDDARRRWNRVRRRRRELSAAFADAPIDPGIAARLDELSHKSTEGERFEAISQRLTELLDGPDQSKGRRVPGMASGPSSSSLLLELAGAMLELLRAGEPEP